MEVVKKQDVAKWIEEQLRQCGGMMSAADKAGSYHVNLNGSRFRIHHKHKNEAGSLVGHISPEGLEKLAGIADIDEIPSLAFSFMFFNPIIQRDELFVFICTIEKIKRLVNNKYFGAFELGSKTGNIIFKYGKGIDRDMILSESDILCANLYFPHEVGIRD